MERSKGVDANTWLENVARREEQALDKTLDDLSDEDKEVVTGETGVTPYGSVKKQIALMSPSAYYRNAGLPEDNMHSVEVYFRNLEH